MWKTILLLGIISQLVGCITKDGVRAYTRPIRVGPEGFNSTFGYYGTTPESPDGLMIAYVKLLQETGINRDEMVPGEIWVCNSDLSNHLTQSDQGP